MKTLYKYQTELVKGALKKLKSQDQIVLAAAPSSGKTIMGIEIAKRYKRVLILASGYTLIRDQWETYFLEMGIDYTVLKKNFSFSDIPETGIILAIPQSLNKAMLKKIGAVDLLIVDEAHQRYLADQMKKIIKAVSPKKQLLLTGSPSLYNDNPEFDVLGISIASLLKQDVVFDPKITIVNSSFDISQRDINSHLELKESARLTEEQIISTLSNVLADLGDCGKTMIIAPKQREAIIIAKWFEERGRGCEISVSSLNDGQKELNAFVNDPEKHFFVVVNRGTIGFDFSELETIVDLSFTQHIDKLFQAICRLIRKPKTHNISEKRYVKVATDKTAVRTYASLMTAVSLSQDDNYFKFTRDYQKWTLEMRKEDYNRFANINAKSLRDLSVKDLPKLLSMKELSRLRCSLDEVVSISFSQLTRTRYSVETALELARKSLSRVQYRTRFNGAYNFLQENAKLSLLDAIFPKEDLWHWNKKTKEENLAKLKEEAKKYTVKHLWRLNNSAGHKWLKKNGLEHEITFPKTLTRWTKKKVLEAAVKYETFNKFRQAHGGAYEYAERHGFLNEINLPRLGTNTPRQPVIQTVTKREDRDRQTLKELIAKRKMAKRKDLDQAA